MKLPIHFRHLVRLALALTFVLLLGIWIGGSKLQLFFDAFVSSIGLGRNKLLRTIHEFPEGTVIDSIAVRRDGRLLITLASAPEVWSIDPFTSCADLVHRFEDTNAVLGITETEHDVFAVATGNWSDQDIGEVGSVRKLILHTTR